MSTIDIKPPVLQWAQQRSGRANTEMRDKFADWDQWLDQVAQPTYAQLEKISAYTRIPIGYFFLPEPPLEELPIPDFRVGRDGRLPASDALLDTIYLNQRRQAWYEEYLTELGDPDPITFVGSARTGSVEQAAALITDALGYSVGKRAELGTTHEARNYLISRFEELGGLVVINSMVENNTHRPLDLEEFRGFTLHSTIAPLVFINGKDTKNGQIFSLLHEFAHIWRGDSGVSAGGQPLRGRVNHVERWCDAVAAEIAVPAADLRDNFETRRELTTELDRLAGRYHCSTLVILLRLRDTRLIATGGDAGEFDDLYTREVDRLIGIIEQLPQESGGNFYNNQPFRVGRTLSEAIIHDVKIGNTSMTEALRLLAFRRTPMFDTYAQRLGAA